MRGRGRRSPMRTRHTPIATRSAQTAITVKGLTLEAERKVCASSGLEESVWVREEIDHPASSTHAKAVTASLAIRFTPVLLRTARRIDRHSSREHAEPDTARNALMAGVAAAEMRTCGTRLKTTKSWTAPPVRYAAKTWPSS